MGQRLFNPSFKRQAQTLRHGEQEDPAILWIHGGPEGQDSFRLDVWAQYLAQEGYVALEPNYRGSTGYGEKFRNLNVEDSGGGEMDDVAAGAHYLIDHGLADPKRIAIGGGGSHGGTMTAYAVTGYPQLFAAAIVRGGFRDSAPDGHVRDIHLRVVGRLRAIDRQTDCGDGLQIPIRE